MPSTRRTALVLLVTFAATVAAGACGGTTEARVNPDLEPGSGDLGSGDLADVPDSGLEPDDDPLAATGSTTAPQTGASCREAAGKAEIGDVLATFHLTRSTFEERRHVVQMGDDPDVVSRLATADAQAAAHGAPPVRSVRVTTVECVDDGAAVVAFVVSDADDVHRTATVMLVDGSWRYTLDAMCRNTPDAHCETVPGLLDRAHDALSPALRT